MYCPHTLCTASVHESGDGLGEGDGVGVGVGDGIGVGIGDGVGLGDGPGSGVLFGKRFCPFMHFCNSFPG